MGRRAISVAEKNARKRFGASLRRARTTLGMGLHEAARASGLNHTSLARMESGERPINPVDLRSLASCYNVPWQALVIAQSGQLPMALAASAIQAPQAGGRTRGAVTPRRPPGCGRKRRPGMPVMSRARARAS